MTENRIPLVSICIPTCKREEIVDQLLESILRQQIPQDAYEICITDNSDTDETKNLIERKYSDIPNLRYKKVTCKGFMNSLEALRSGHGKYLKLHNDYSILKKGALAAMLREVKEADEAGDYIYFIFGKIPDQSGKMSFSSFNDFMNHISFQATWSSAFGIWKADFDRIEAEGIAPDTMYPHTSYLHRLTDQKRYIVDNTEYVTNVAPKKKGGYNLVDNFVRIYLTMLRNDLLSKGHITRETYDKIEDRILDFCAEWYYYAKWTPDTITFRFENDERIIRETCGPAGLRKYRLHKGKWGGRYVLKKIAKPFRSE